MIEVIVEHLPVTMSNGEGETVEESEVLIEWIQVCIEEERLDRNF